MHAPECYRERLADNSLLGMDLADEVSRVKSVTSHGRGFGNYDRTHTSAFKVSGRHVFNIWRILRGELNLLGYSFENVAFHLLRQR